MTIEIDLSQKLESETIDQLQLFFNAQSAKGVRLWKSYEIFTFDDGEQFYFTHTVLQRNRKENPDGVRRDGVRYEVIPPRTPLGKGSFGTVYEIAGTLQFREDGTLFKRCGKDGLGRVLKREKHTDDNPLEMTENEYHLLKEAGHLAVKVPVLIGSRTYLVMNRLSGQTLKEILDDDRDGYEILTTEQRLNLSNALLLALKEQVTDKKIVHRDIKPENIFVDMDETPIKVAIMDYGLGFFAEHPDGCSSGTIEYMSPEVFCPDKLDYKSDVYSMARVIALVWQVNLDTYDPSLNIENIDNWRLKNRLQGLFSYLSVPVEYRNEIYIALSGMLKIYAKNRYSIEQAIAKFPSSRNVQAKLSMGISLGELLKQDYNNSNRLTMEQRFDLSNALLTAVEQQIRSKRRVHGGLNPSTIYVDLNDSYAVTIFDHGLGFDEDMGFAGDIPDGEYIAPEFINGLYSIDNKVDVYSVALILAFIWHLNVNAIKINNSERKYMGCNNIEQDKIPCKGINPRIETQIIDTLQKMLKINPAERYSLLQASIQFPTENKNIEVEKTVADINKKVLTAAKIKIQGHYTIGQVKANSAKHNNHPIFEENKENANKRLNDGPLYPDGFFNKKPKFNIELPLPELDFQT